VGVGLPLSLEIEQGEGGGTKGRETGQEVNFSRSAGERVNFTRFHMSSRRQKPLHLFINEAKKGKGEADSLGRGSVICLPETKIDQGTNEEKKVGGYLLDLK